MLKYKLFIISLVITVMVICGCAARKVHKKVLEIEQKEKVEEKTTETKKIKKDSTVLVITSDYDFEPIDVTLPFTIDGKLFNNVRIKASNHSSDIRVSVEEESLLDVIKSSQKELTINEMKKETEKREAFPFWIFIIVFIIGYYLYTKKN